MAAAVQTLAQCTKSLQGFKASLTNKINSSTRTRDFIRDNVVTQDSLDTLRGDIGKVQVAFDRLEQCFARICEIDNDNIDDYVNQSTDYETRAHTEHIHLLASIAAAHAKLYSPVPVPDPLPPRPPPLLLHILVLTAISNLLL